MTIKLVKDTLKMIRAALHKLRGLGFHEAVIATDHGFFLNAHAQAGDVCKKPAGNWLLKTHDRMLFGEGDSDSGNLVVGLEKVGIRGAFSKCAIPKSIAPYKDGHLYFHGGASLQEALVPVLVVKMNPAEAAEKPSVKVELSYKQGAKKITTRLPVIEIVLYTEDLFTQELEILLEAHDDKGNVIGEPRQGPEVNAATRTITLKPKEPVQVIMKMSSDFEGKFTIKALDPKTLTEYSSLKLETDYLA